MKEIIQIKKCTNMADYWFSNRKEKSSIFSSVDSLARHVKLDGADDRNICATGNDINFNELFKFPNSDQFNFVIKNVQQNRLIINYKIPKKITFKVVKINEIEFNKSDICSYLDFVDCHIEELKIISFNQLGRLQISKCIVSKLTILNSSYISDFSIVDSKIENLKIGTSKTLDAYNEVPLIGKLRITSLDDINAVWNASIKDCKFISPLSISKSSLKNFNITQCSFNSNTITLEENVSSNIYFERCIFNSLKNLIFKKCEGTLIFDNCIFKDELEVSEEMDVTGVKSEEELKLIIKDSVFRELIFFTESIIKSVIFLNSLFVKSIFLPTNRFEPENISSNVSSSVWCIKKNQALEKNDKITALYYRKLELISYSKEIRNKRGGGEDRVLLFLNNISNLHGLSWKRGISFTLSSWLFIFTLYYWSLWGNQINFDWHYLIFGYKEFWSDAFNFLWLPSSDLKDISRNELEQIGGGSLFFVLTLYVLGKIIIGYGVYQTVAAFRKHVKL
jgi:hypothetical protein